MADLNIFIYKQGNSIIHKSHPTLKIILLSLASVLITYGNYFTLSYFFIITLIGCYISKSRLLNYLKDLRYLLILFIVISIFQSSIFIGFIYIIRIFEIIILGSLLIQTTKPVNLPSAIYKIIRVKSIANNISLTIGLIPTFLICWKEIEEGLNSRGVYLIKNPLVRIKGIVIPLFIEIFKKADNISMAMDARCYNNWIEEDISDNYISKRVILIFLFPLLLHLKMLLL